MKLSVEEFRKWPHKAITLLGMSGIGKTTVGSVLPRNVWFHYSGDYRIGTRYLDEAILDHVKTRAMQHPELRMMLQNDHIYLRNNIAIDNLEPLSNYLGKIGDPDQGGLSLHEFKRRQKLFCHAEQMAMNDVPTFIDKGQSIYRYPHFLNDAGGSICGLDDQTWDMLSEHTLILYLRADNDLEQTLAERARRYPKPLVYEEEFLDSALHTYLQENGISDIESIEPDRFVQWVFPKLIDYRRPMYEAICEKYGYAVDARLVFELKNEDDFLAMVCDVIGSSDP
ncbi:MAG: ATPase [Pseudomonadota bacterium]